MDPEISSWVEEETEISPYSQSLHRNTTHNDYQPTASAQVNKFELFHNLPVVVYNQVQSSQTFLEVKVCSKSRNKFSFIGSFTITQVKCS